ncbi:MAG: serine--tRNA ligase, partial [Lentisphaerae bacterium]|nr:serine--tRNA ligase [Lentisphaerota bacterium]
MLDIRLIRENPESVAAALKRRGIDGSVIKDVQALDIKRRSLVTETESLKHERNRASQEVGKMKQSGQSTEQLQLEIRELGKKISDSESLIRETDETLRQTLLFIPNIPHVSTPDGSDASDNVEVKQWGTRRDFDFQPKTHLELGESLGIFDFARGAKLTGAGFPLYIGLGARLERALIQFMLDIHVNEHGYTEVSTPFMCNTASMTGTGQLPKMEEDMYSVPEDGLWLIPTAEVPVTNIFRDEIIEPPLPVYFCAYSPCSR